MFRKYVETAKTAALSGIFVVAVSFATWAFALDSLVAGIATQSATGTGSNGSTVWVSTGTTSTGGQYLTEYVNRDDDSATVGNYLRGYYYDTVYGFFRLDWDSADPSNNVRVSDSTDRCGNGYGYRFDGFARGIDAGFLDFGYDDSTFVYYCESDGLLHGYAYSPDSGFQNFEGISVTLSAFGSISGTGF